MAYQKQTWRDYDDNKTEVVNMNQGAVVTPERLNHMETGIANSADKAQVTAQLQQAEYEATRKRKLEDLDPEVLSAIEGGEGTSFNLLSVPQDKSVTPKKTNFLNFKSSGKNLYNKDSTGIEKNTLLLADGTKSTNATYELTDFFPVTQGVLHASRSGITNSPMFRSIGLYDANKNPISITEPASSNPQTIPSGVSFARICHPMSDTDFQLEIGTGVTTYEPYREIYSFDESKIHLPESEEALKITRKTSLTKNLYNPAEVIKNKLLNADGTMSDNGTYGVTGKIPVEEYQYVSVSRGAESTSSPLIRTFVWFDNNDLPIGGNNDGALSPIQAPQGARWLQITHNPLDKQYQVEVSSSPTSYVSFAAGEQLDTNKVKSPVPTFLTSLQGKVLIGDGDSIMAAQFPADPTGYETLKYGFAQRVADTFGMRLENYAIGGSTLAVNPNAPTERTPLIERYQNLPNYGDVYLFNILSNDFANSWTPPGDMSSRDNHTTYGALHNLCLGLLEKLNGKQIIFMTPIKRSYGTLLALPESENAFGLKLSDYADILKEVCGYYGYEVIDMNRICPLNPHIPSQRAKYIPDGTHPNTEGHGIMALPVIGHFKQLV